VGRKLVRQQTRRERAQKAWDDKHTRLREVIEASEPKGHPPAPITPKNHNQKNAIAALQRGTEVVMLTGSAGTGKSMIAAHRAANQLHYKKVDKVWLVRPAVSVGKSVGMLPGDIKEKLTPYFRQTIAHLEKFLGKGHVEAFLNEGKIEMMPVEYLRGMSFEDCLVIAEECQNFTHEEMEMMLTRLGENAQLIFTGDTKQNDLRTASGLKTTMELIERMLQTHPNYMTHDDLDMLDDCVAIIKFKPEDVVRSGLTRAFVTMYYHNDERNE
jgi:phosphate starvation-inducible protein PhoH and related proteins